MSVGKSYIVWLWLVGLPAFVLCGLTHICMDGHMKHPPYPWWHFLSDGLWVTSFVVSAFLLAHSDFAGHRTLVNLFAVLLLSRAVFRSAEGIFILVLELPIALAVCVFIT